MNFSTSTYTQDASDYQKRHNLFSCSKKTRHMHTTHSLQICNGRSQHWAFPLFWGGNLPFPKTSWCKKVDLEMTTIVWLFQHSRLSVLIFISSQRRCMSSALLQSIHPEPLLWGPSSSICTVPTGLTMQENNKNNPSLEHQHLYSLETKKASTITNISLQQQLWLTNNISVRYGGKCLNTSNMAN